MNQKTSIARRVLRASTALSALVMVEAGLLAAPAYAQDTSPQPAAQDPVNADQTATDAPEAQTAAPTVPATDANDGSSNEEIVVTGSIFRRTNTETPSPVTVLSSESLARRGITNVGDAVRSISADNAGSVPTAFSNGFGSGGAAPALRGLTVNSTLTLIDGTRMVGYPLADDGQRAFVDLNTIPRVAIERIEVLKDGASSTYGADAIGGVVNIIMRKHYTGIEGNVQAGMTQRGDGENFRASILAGSGDYNDRGFNIYGGLEIETNKEIFTRDRGFPFNTADLSDRGGVNLNWDILNGDTLAGPVAQVRPATQSDITDPLSGTAISGGLWQLVNPAQCAAYDGTLTSSSAGQGCEVNQYDNQFVRLAIQPKTLRFGGVVRASAQVGDNADAYLMGSFYRSETTLYPAYSSVRSNNPVRTLGISLPALLSDGSLNPYNPFAAAGQAALLRFRFPNVDREASLESNVFRGVGGISGTFLDGFRYQVDVGAMSSSLRRQNSGNIHIPTLINVINNGTYNFANPTATDPAIVSSLLRTVESTATAQLYLAQGIITKDLFELPGGPLQLGIGAQIRREQLDNPNQNPANELIGVNQVFARGQRTVKAGFFEVNAPILEQLEMQLGGRYESYSTGFSNFSPKVGVKITPISQIALRGTFSKGFRAPSFAESGEAGVIGFVNATPPCVVRLQHGATGTVDSCTAGNGYVAPQALGFRSTGNPDLGPEKSRSFTLGLVAQPIRSLSFTLDYYNIRKTEVITQGPLSADALAAFYNGEPIPAGYSVVTNAPDPDFPAATPVVAIVNSPYVNASEIRTSGIDFSALFQTRLSPTVKFSSALEVSKIIKFDFYPEKGAEPQSYAGTLGPYQLSSGAGTPRYRGNWSNSLDFGRATLTGTAYYVSRYKDVSEDTSGAGTRGSCAAAGELYSEEYCYTKRFIHVDLVGSYEFTDNITGYFNIFNLFDKKAPIEPANYAGPAANYNPTWHQTGAVGRAFRLGANFKFGGRRAMPAPAPVYVAPPAPAPVVEPAPVYEQPAPPPPAPAPERG